MKKILLSLLIVSLLVGCNKNNKNNTPIKTNEQNQTKLLRQIISKCNYVVNFNCYNPQQNEKLHNKLDDKLKEIWTDFNGYKAQAQYFPEMNSQFLNYAKAFEPEEMDDTFFFMRKMVINYLLYKKYAKLNSTYVGSDGMFKKKNKYVYLNHYQD